MKDRKIVGLFYKKKKKLAVVADADSPEPTLLT